MKHNIADVLKNKEIKKSHNLLKVIKDFEELFIGFEYKCLGFKCSKKDFHYVLKNHIKEEHTFTFDISTLNNEKKDIFVYLEVNFNDVYITLNFVCSQKYFNSIIESK